MSLQRHFTIDQVSWHTRLDPAASEAIKRQFKIVAHFLQTNGLTVRVLLAPGVEPTDEFAIGTSDLTEEGFAVMKKGYDRWLGKVDKTRDPTDLRILERALAKIRDRQGD